MCQDRVKGWHNSIAAAPVLTFADRSGISCFDEANNAVCGGGSDFGSVIFPSRRMSGWFVPDGSPHFISSEEIDDDVDIGWN